MTRQQAPSQIFARLRARWPNRYTRPQHAKRVCVLNCQTHLHATSASAGPKLFSQTVPHCPALQTCTHARRQRESGGVGSAAAALDAGWCAGQAHRLRHRGKPRPSAGPQVPIAPLPVRSTAAPYPPRDGPCWVRRRHAAAAHPDWSLCVREHAQCQNVCVCVVCERACPCLRCSCTAVLEGSPPGIPPHALRYTHAHTLCCTRRSSAQPRRIHLPPRS